MNPLESILIAPTSVLHLSETHGDIPTGPGDELPATSPYDDDLGSCDPCSDDDGFPELDECPMVYATWLLRSGVDRATVLTKTIARFGPDVRDINGVSFANELRAAVFDEPELAETFGRRLSEVFGLN